MNVRSAVSAPLLAIGTAVAVLASTFAMAAYMQRSLPAGIPLARPDARQAQPLDPQIVASGRKLFLMNCAHCHADDATGDEGPDLHGLRKTDERLRLLIRNGIKGEMPRFGTKLAEGDLDALVAYLDSLR